MNCKGSPYSAASTGINGSPPGKVKLSRKFKIDLTAESPQKNKEIANLEKKLLRYRRKHKEKQTKYTQQIIVNEELFKKIKESDIERKNLNFVFDEEIKKQKNLNENVFESEKTLEKFRKKLEEENDFDKNLEFANENLELKPSASKILLLENLQEELFASNKKANDLERFLSKEQKKNENLAKELRSLKIDLSSKLA